MTETESRVVAAWREAAADLGIRFTSPVSITAPDGRHHECIGLVHQFGRRIGTLISVIGEPSEQAQYSADAADADYFVSKLGAVYGRYNRQWFIDTLNDWQFFGSDAERPEWYSGAPW
jgi:hypothetical protein